MPSRWDTVEVDDEAMQVYVGHPSAAGPHPGVVVVQQAAGVGHFLQTIVDRLAGEGFLAAAPDLYHRQNDNLLEEAAKLPLGHPDRRPKFLDKAGRLRDQEMIADVNATVAYLRGSLGTQVGDIGITGFCIGGRVAYLMTARSAVLKAAGVFYPTDILSATSDGPSPLEQTSAIRCPLIAFFGEDDSVATPAQALMMSEALTKENKVFDLHFYPGAGHGFMEFDSPGLYREDAAENAWDRLITFFHAQLGAGA